MSNTSKYASQIASRFHGQVAKKMTKQHTGRKGGQGHLDGKREKNRNKYMHFPCYQYYGAAVAENALDSDVCGYVFSLFLRKPTLLLQ